MTAADIQIVVLAAGEGTRMKSALPKVLHKVAGRSLLGHVMGAVAGAGASHVAVVIGPGRDDVAKEAAQHVPNAEAFVQAERLGTAHAVLAARRALERRAAAVVIAFADTPLVRPQTIRRLADAVIDGGAAVAALAFRPADPKGYGRLVTEGDRLIAIREEKDASEAERAIALCNAGLMALSGAEALPILEAIGNDNAQREYYLPDAVGQAVARNLKTTWLEASAEEVMGINDRAQLAAAERLLQERLRAEALAAGVTMTAPETVFLAADTRFGRDVVIEPHVVFGEKVAVGDNVTIRSFSHLEGAVIEADARIGPYARLRPGAKIGRDAHIGNFVEVKEATVGEGAKANHFAYLGDAVVGARSNIGAGTITCNYDGFAKHRTELGAGVFVGSNSTLVAPLRIANGAYVAAGSVVTRDVAEDALAIGRSRQTNKENGGAKLRTHLAAVKEAQKGKTKG